MPSLHRAVAPAGLAGASFSSALYGAPAFVGTVARGYSGVFAAGAGAVAVGGPCETPPWWLHAPRPFFEVEPSLQVTVPAVAGVSVVAPAATPP